MSDPAPLQEALRTARETEATALTLRREAETRLAFARLFARSGRPVPVILDDALVHSDDDRIEAMFTALHRVAQEQQIIVLTCRQRAFAPLGGERLFARVEGV